MLNVIVVKTLDQIFSADAQTWLVQEDGSPAAVAVVGRHVDGGHEGAVVAFLRHT